LAAPGARSPVLTSSSSAARVILFFDGECGFCDKLIQFIMRRDGAGRLYVAPLAGATAQALLPPFNAVLTRVDSAVLYIAPREGTSARVLVFSDAVLAVLRQLGGLWPALGIAGIIIPRWIRDAMYRAFAARRLKWFGRVEACAIPPASWRDRLLP
jgi:predicted DCC family thiol-disulfide oxidoreductase YuxK